MDLHSVHAKCFFLLFTNYTKHFITLATFTHSHIHTHIYTLMAEAALKGSDLLIRSHAAFPNKSATQYFCAQSSTLIHTSMEQPSGAIWGSVSCQGII